MTGVLLSCWLHFAHVSASALNPGSSNQPHSPVVTAVSPAQAANDLDITLQISGTGFTAILSGSQVITPPSVWLGSRQLLEMGWLSSTHLTATVPWGLEPGVYTLTIVNPDGISGSLASAYNVTQGIGVWSAGELYGGWVDQVAVDPFEAQTVYAAANWVGFFRSQDGGLHWEILYPGVGTFNLAASPALPGRLYMQSIWDLRRSDDGGESWIKLTPNFPVTDTLGENCGDESYLPIAHPTLTDTVFVGLCKTASPSPNGLLRSEDGGETWIDSMDGLTDTQVTAIAFHPTNPLTMYLGTASGRLYVSSNGGESWQYASRPLGYFKSIAVDPFGSHTVWVNSIHGRDTPCETYYSADSSLTNWVYVNPSGWSHFCRKVIFDPVTPGTIYVPFGSGFKTTNGGADWIEFDLGTDNYPIDIAIDDTDPDTLYMSDGARGVYKSMNGGTSWQESNTGLAAMVPTTIEVMPNEPGTVFALVSNGLYKGTQGGAAWQYISPPWMSAIWDVRADPFIPDRLYVGALAGMCLSEDAGETFTGCVQLEPPPEYAGHGIWPQTIAVHPVQPGSLMVGVRYITGTHFLGVGALYRTVDFGGSWTIITSTVGISLPLEIVHDPLNPTVIYVPTLGEWILRSQDGGLSWDHIAEEVPALRNGCTLGVEPVPPGRILTMGMDMGLWVSDDHGDHWVSIPKPPELGINLAALLWLPGEPPTIYGATPTGLSRSLDRGYTWERATGVLGYANVTVLDAVQVDERTVIYAGTTGGSLPPGLHTLEDEIIGAGIYRFTYLQNEQPVYWIFLPVAANKP
jgi:photosystem II stability/assembly factor-like uncharacterized protein